MTVRNREHPMNTEGPLSSAQESVINGRKTESDGRLHLANAIVERQARVAAEWLGAEPG
jgi:hypothetical protein